MDKRVSDISVPALRARFNALWDQCLMPGKYADPDAVWKELARHYSTPDRHYHTLHHIEHCLHTMDMARRYIEDPAAVEMGIWFHDVICEAGAPDNEKRSAALFERTVAHRFDERFTDRVCYLIITTTHDAKPRDCDERFIRDIDLSSFALPWEEFLQDSQAVRAEHPESPDHLFYPAKLRYLTAMLARKSIFLTEFFRKRYEASARQNIQRFIDQIVIDHISG